MRGTPLEISWLTGFGLALPLVVGGCASAPTTPAVPFSGEVRQVLGVVTQVEQGTTTDRGSSIVRSGLSGPVGSELYKSAFISADHIKYTVLTEAEKQILIESKEKLNLGECVLVTYPASTAADRYYFGLGDATLSKSLSCPASRAK